MKFALFFLCVFVVIQGFEANSVKDKVEQGLGDVWETIKTTGTKIGEIFNDIGYYIPRQMEKLKSMATRTNNIIEQYTHSYKQKFQALTSKIEDIGSKCYAANLRDLTNLNNQAGIKLRNCTADLKLQRVSLGLMMDNLTAQTTQTKQRIGRTVQYCMSQYPWWRIDSLFECISERVENPLRDLKDRVHKSFSLVKIAVKVATVDLVKCVANAQKELSDKEKELFVSVKECIRYGVIQNRSDETYPVNVSYNRDIYSTPFPVPSTSPRYEYRSYQSPTPRQRFGHSRGSSSRRNSASPSSGYPRSGYPAPTW